MTDRKRPDIETIATYVCAAIICALVGFFLGAYIGVPDLVIMPALPERGRCSAPDQSGYTICNIPSGSVCSPELRVVEP